MIKQLFGPQPQKSLNHPMDFYEFYRIIAPAIAAIKCGHTGISLSPDVVAGLKHREVVKKSNVEDGKAFMKRSFEAIYAKGCSALILDVRDNGGGGSELGGTLRQTEFH